MGVFEADRWGRNGQCQCAFKEVLSGDTAQLGSYNFNGGSGINGGSDTNYGNVGTNWARDAVNHEAEQDADK